MKFFSVRTLIFTNLFLELLLLGMFLYRKYWIFLIVLCVFMLLYHIKRFNRFFYIEFEPLIVIGQTKIDLSSCSKKNIPDNLGWLFHVVVFIVLLTLIIATFGGALCQDAIL